MIKKRMLRTVSAQLLYQTAIKYGLKCSIVSSRFNLFSIIINNKKIYIKGTSLPVNSQSSSSISSNKYLSKKILKEFNIPTPKSWLVKTISSAKKIIITKNLFPCVIKPIYGSHGDEIYANIETTHELNSVLRQFSLCGHKNILIEKYIKGIDYRILIVDNKISAITERIPAHIIGDGKNSIKTLIQLFNKNPLVGKKYEKPMCKIRINFELKRTLRKQNLLLSSIIDKNKTIYLKQNANISSGGISKDVTNTVKPKIKKIALKTAHVLNMDFCGVDIIYNPKTNESYVLEINDCPGIDIHHFPILGQGHDVAGDIIKYIVKKEIKNSALLTIPLSLKNYNVISLKNELHN